MPKRTRYSSTQYRTRARPYTGRYSGKYKNYTPSSYSVAESKRAYKHLAVYKDPFSRATHLPRIPDGKAITSIGLKNRVIGEVTIENAANASTDILLFPGLNAWVCIDDVDGETDLIYMGSNILEQSAISGTAGTGITLDQQTATNIHRWRMVSCGMHCALTNNAEQNDGWWEAVRFGTPTDAREYLFGFDATADAQAIVPFSPFAMGVDNLVNLPSYTSGKLRDIHRTQFNLRPEGNEHQFISLRDTYELASTDLLATTDIFFAGTAAANASVQKLGAAAGIATTGFTGDNLKQHDFVNSRVDFGYDVILLRIHGRGDTAPSRIKIEAVANHEIIYDERATNSRFHQRAEIAPNFTAAKASLQRSNDRAGKPVGKTKTI